MSGAYQWSPAKVSDWLTENFGPIAPFSEYDTMGPSFVHALHAGLSLYLSMTGQAAGIVPKGYLGAVIPAIHYPNPVIRAWRCGHGRVIALSPKLVFWPGMFGKAHSGV